ncbi:hypothetical protein ACKKBG_A06315 [Auxenochlorella protothecoides x Auxenochlorella symbiontica]
MGQIGAERCLHTPQADAAEGPPGPLAGIKVLDLGQVVAGNFAGALLAYYGADVVKVEPPGKGDALRSLRLADASGTSLWWRSYGRNRRCITVDLHSAAGQGVVRRLAGRSDVLVENFRPGVMEGWGLGPKDLPPHLIYTRISGYGQTGPRAREPGYASVCEAYGGLRAINGFPDGPPIRPNISLGDSLAGLHAAFGAVMALLHRDRARGPGGACAGLGTPSGSGQVVDVAISESIFNMMEGAVPEWFTHRAIRPPSGTTLTNVVPSGAWQAQDGKYVIIGGNGNSGLGCPQGRRRPCLALHLRLEPRPVSTVAATPKSHPSPPVQSVQPARGGDGEGGPGPHQPPLRHRRRSERERGGAERRDCDVGGGPQQRGGDERSQSGAGARRPHPEHG